MHVRSAVLLCGVATCVALTSCGVLCDTLTLPKAAAPTFSLASGTYDHPIEVTIRCDTEGATIHYTTDGSRPTRCSAVYDSQPIAITQHVAVGDDPDPNDEYEPLATESMLIKAIAVADCMCTSDVSTARYVVDKVDSTFNIPYDEPPPAGGDKHKLDIYQPHGQSGTKVVFFAYGGAWKQGDKNIYLELGNTFAGYYNYTTVIINYQLSAEPWNAVHPTHVEDIAKAFAWVHDNIADYGGDPNGIYVFGQSAGAHLVSLLATDGRYLAAHGLTPDAIKALISMSGAYDLYDLVELPDNPLGLPGIVAVGFRGICQNAFGAWDEETLTAASPATYANASQPPFFLIHAWDDLPGFSQEAINFHQQLTDLGCPVEILLLEESDIPPEVLALGYTGHGAEIYAINTRNWNSVSTRAVVDYIEAH